MRSITGSLNQLQALIEVRIGSPAEPMRQETCTALLDTGATRTCVTQRLINELNLEPRRKLLVSSATNDPARRMAYAYSLGLFCEGFGGVRTLYTVPHEFIAPSFHDNPNFDVLLGMDILSQGQLVIDRGNFRFDFDF